MGDIVILDIDLDDVLVESDKGASNLSIDSDKDRKKNVRKVASGGGKAPHVAVSFKPVRKPQVVEPEINNDRRKSLRSRGRPKEKSSKNIECFEIGDSESDNSDASDEDEIQVLDDTVDGIDPDLEEISILGGVTNTDGFCELCGLYLDTITDIEQHHVEVHKIVLCKWCNKKVTLSKIRSHIGSSCPKFDKILGSHCSIHNKMETDEMLSQEEFKNCRPWSCDACGQRYDKKSLMEPAEIPDSFVCPGCLHGRVKSLDANTENLEKVVEEIDIDEETPSIKSVVLDIIDEIIVGMTHRSVEPALRRDCLSGNTTESTIEPFQTIDDESEAVKSQGEGEIDIDAMITEVESRVINYLINTSMDFLNKTNGTIFDATTVEVTPTNNTSNPKENIDLENNSPVKGSDKQIISPTKEVSLSEALLLASDGVVRLDDTENGEIIGSNYEKVLATVSDPEDIVLLDEESQEKFIDKKEKSSDVSPDQQRVNSAEKSIGTDLVSPENDGSFPVVVSLDLSQDSQLPKRTSEGVNIIALDEEEGGKKKLPEERVRRVAKKSTRPPIQPQTQPSEEELRKHIENPRKRSAESPKGSPPRKTARKSTRPPIAPQVLSFMFVDESKEEEDITEVQEVSDNDEVTEMTTAKTQRVPKVAEDREKEWEKIREQAWDTSDDVSKTDNSVLLDSPDKGSDKLDEDSDIEEITIC